MESGNSKYDKVTGFLKKSKPELGDEKVFSERVIRQIRERKSTAGLEELIYEFLFGWVYIGWVRKSMITASLALVLFFGYQQTVIMKRIKSLSGQEQISGNATMTGMTDEIANKMLLYKYLGSNIPEGSGIVSEKEIKRLVRSRNDLKVRYKDILRLIENDPELKKYVEEKLKENENAKPKI
jgi:hypothetical protein